MKIKTDEFAWAIMQLNQILTKAKMSMDLKDAVIEIKTALEQGDTGLAADLSAVKSLISGTIGQTFSEDGQYNTRMLKDKVYGILDELHSQLAQKTGTISSGLVILSVTKDIRVATIEQRPDSKLESPTLKKIKAEKDKSRKRAEKVWV